MTCNIAATTENQEGSAVLGPPQGSQVEATCPQAFLGYKPEFAVQVVLRSVVICMCLQGIQAYTCLIQVSDCTDRNPGYF